MLKRKELGSEASAAHDGFGSNRPHQLEVSFVPIPLKNSSLITYCTGLIAGITQRRIQRLSFARRGGYRAFRTES